MDRPIRLRFKIPMLHKQIIVLDESKSDTYIEIILDENDDLKSGKYVFVSKDSPQIREEINLESKLYPHSCATK
jgi:hypothetical protein